MTSLLAVLALIGSATAQPSATFSFITPASDAASAPLQAEADISRRAIEKFFGKPFVNSVAVTIVGSRKEFDAAIPAAWGVTPSQCWMVGAGVYDRLIMLSPTAWAKDACDHKPGDVDEAKQIMRHELTHVIHGRYNPTHDFTGLDDAAWFIEGLATYVSGQLDDKRLARAQAALGSGKGPTGLADACRAAKNTASQVRWLLVWTRSTDAQSSFRCSTRRRMRQSCRSSERRSRRLSPAGRNG